MPLPAYSVVFGKVKEWKDGKEVETDKDNVINETNPLWTRKPAEIKEEDYMEFTGICTQCQKILCLISISMLTILSNLLVSCISQGLRAI